MKPFTVKQAGVLCLLAFSLLFASPAVLTAGEADTLFRRANETYSREDFEEAIALYRQCLDLAESAALHYNLGNAYYKTGDTGRALFHYEKALALDPSDPDVHTNLNFVREAAELPPLEYGPLTRFALWLPLNLWCWLAMGGFWGLIALALLLRLFGGGNSVIRLLFAASFVLTITAAVALIGYHAKSKEGVIFQEDTPLRVAPTAESPAAAYLQAGQLATIEKTHQDFYFLHTTTGKTGWVRAEEIGKIWD